jgi:hypothetical protein
VVKPIDQLPRYQLADDLLKEDLVYRAFPSCEVMKLLSEISK